MSDIDFSQYDQFLKDAERDDRIGRQTMTITEVHQGAWPSGDPYTEVNGLLATAGNAKINVRISAMPDPSSLVGLEGTKKRAIAQTINFHKQLAKLGKRADQLAAGDELGVEVVKNRDGYLRIAAFMAPTVPGSAARDPVPGF
jgi:hypothetical protein